MKKMMIYCTGLLLSYSAAQAMFTRGWGQLRQPATTFGRYYSATPPMLSRTMGTGGWRTFAPSKVHPRQKDALEALWETKRMENKAIADQKRLQDIFNKKTRTLLVDRAGMKGFYKGLEETIYEDQKDPASIEARLAYEKYLRENQSDIDKIAQQYRQQKTLFENFLKRASDTKKVARKYLSREGR